MKSRYRVCASAGLTSATAVVLLACVVALSACTNKFYANPEANQKAKELRPDQNRALVRVYRDDLTSDGIKTIESFLVSGPDCQAFSPVQDGTAKYFSQHREYYSIAENSYYIFDVPIGEFTLTSIDRNPFSRWLAEEHTFNPAPGEELFVRISYGGSFYFYWYTALGTSIQVDQLTGSGALRHSRLIRVIHCR